MIDPISGAGVGETPRPHAVPVRASGIESSRIEGDNDSSQLLSGEEETELSSRKQADGGRAAAAGGHGIRFKVNKDSGDLVVQIVDRSSEEVIKQIPSGGAEGVGLTLDTSA